MKRISLLLIFLLLLCGCSARHTLGLEPPLVALIAPDTAAADVPDPSQLFNALGAQALAVQHFTTVTGDSSADMIPTALAEGCNLFVLYAGSEPAADQALAVLRPLNLPVIFYGVAPRELADYDKAWYVGEGAAKQGELLGEALVSAYKNGQITDKNGDHLLQYISLSTQPQPDARIACALRILENYGIFQTDLAPETVACPDEESAYQNTLVLLNTPGNTPELLLAPTPASCVGAARAIQETGLVLPLASFGAGTELDALLENGQLLTSCSLNFGDMAELIATFARNAADKKSVTDGTAVYLDKNSALADFALISAAPSPAAH